MLFRSGKEKQSFSLPEDMRADGRPPRIRVFPTRVAVSFDGGTVMAGDSAGGLHSWSLKEPGSLNNPAAAK